MYDLRYSKIKTDVEDSSKWDLLTSLNKEDLVEGTLDPVEGGNLVQLKLKPQLFDTDTSYFLAMKASDERNAVSGKSNIVRIARLIPPGTILDLHVNLESSNITLNFTALGEDDKLGKGRID